MKDYQVVREFSPERLESQVKGFLSRGYEVVGGIVVVPTVTDDKTQPYM